MNVRANGRFLLRFGGIVALVVASSLGCGLILDFDPPEARHMECLATVENGEGVRVDVSSLTHPDFVENIPTFSGGGGVPTGGSGGTAPLRPYYVCTTSSCGPCFFATPADAEADWRRWLEQRIAEVAAGPDSPSLFRMHAGPWCVVPGSLRCEEREIVDRDPSCGPALTAGPISDCGTTPPPPGQCLEVSCRGGAPCTAIDFGLVATGASATETVTLRNCGGETDRAVTIQVDPVVRPLTLDADFAVPRNGCRVRPGDPALGRQLTTASLDPAESTCDFDLTFTPMHAGYQEGEITFASDLDPSHRIRLSGQVEGGGLTIDRTSVWCLDPAPPGGCTAEQIVRVTNGGPGAVTIRGISFGTGTGNFFVRRPPPPPYPIVLAPGAPPLEVAIQWCPGGAAETGGDLNFDTNADPPLPPLKVGHLDPGNCT